MSHNILYNKTQLWLIFFLLLAGVTAVWAGDVTLEKVGELHIGGDFIRCGVAGSLLYLTDGWGLGIYDVSNPAQVRKLGEIALPGFSERVIIAGDYAYVSSFYTGVEIVDVKDPAHPQLIREIDLNLRLGTVNSLQQVGDRLYVNAMTQLPPADTSAQYVYVVDITDPPRAKVLYTIQHDASFVQVRENFLYLLRFDRLTTLDISDPVWPRATSVISFYNQNDVALQMLGEYLYIVGGSDGVLVLSLRDPAKPQRIGSLRQSFRSFGAVVENNTIAVNEPGQGIRLIDLSDPTTPRQVSYIPVWNVWGMFLVDRRLYFVDNDNQLQIWDVSKPSQPVSVGNLLGVRASLLDVVVQGGYAYVTNFYEGLRVIDVHDPKHPQNVAILPLPFEWPYYGTSRLVIKYPAIYLTNNQSLIVVDVRQPTQPKIISELALGGVAQGIDVSYDDDIMGYIAYVGLENGNLVIVDMHSYPLSIIKTLQIGPGRIRDVLVRGEYVYLAREDFGFTVLERIRRDDPVEVQHIADMDTPGYVESVALYGDKILLADAYSGLTVVDASKIDSPVVTAVKPGGSRENTVTVIGGYALLGTDESVQVWDLRSPEFTRLTSIEFPSNVYRICAQGNWVFVAAQKTFIILQLKTDLLVDLDNDKHTTILDVKNLLEQRVGLLPPSESLADADLNNDGQVTAYDAALLLNAITQQPLPAPQYGASGLEWESKPLDDSSYEINVMFTGSPVWATEFTISYSASEVNVLPSSIKWHLPESAIAVQSLIKVTPYWGKLSLAFASPVSINIDQPFITFIVGNPSVRKSYLIMGGDVVINDGVFQAGKELILSFKSVPLFTLLQSYPNPSRQEVWIPFILLEDADLIIRVYTVDGQLVRKLELNSKRANSYIDRETAAYWDGRNTTGQQVSSGVYFYQVSAGKFSATRKIAIVK
jgi:hypothetical protein